MGAEPSVLYREVSLCISMGAEPSVLYREVSLCISMGAEPSVLYREVSLCISMGQNQVSFIERCPYVLVWGRTKTKASFTQKVRNIR